MSKNTRVLKRKYVHKERKIKKLELICKSLRLFKRKIVEICRRSPQGDRELKWATFGWDDPQVGVKIG